MITLVIGMYSIIQFSIFPWLCIFSTCNKAGSIAPNIRFPVACGGACAKFNGCPKKSEKIPKNAFYVFKIDKFFFNHKIMFFGFFENFGNFEKMP